MIDRKDWEFRVVSFTEKETQEFNLPADSCGILYALYTPQNKAFWFDNYSLEWQGSIYPANVIINDPDFVKVDDNWDNGYISIDDAINGTAPQSLDYYYPAINSQEIGELTL